MNILGENPTEFHSFGRVGSGCTQEELSELGAKLAPHWRRVKTGIMPPNIIWTKEKPDLWIEPKNSIILQVLAGHRSIQKNKLKKSAILGKKDPCLQELEIS